MMRKAFFSSVCAAFILMVSSGCVTNLSSVPNSDDHAFTHYDRSHYMYKLAEECHREGVDSGPCAELADAREKLIEGEAPVAYESGILGKDDEVDYKKLKRVNKKLKRHRKKQSRKDDDASVKDKLVKEEEELLEERGLAIGGSSSDVVKINPLVVELAESCGHALNKKRKYDQKLNTLTISLAVIAGFSGAITGIKATQASVNSPNEIPDGLSLAAVITGAVAAVSIPIVQNARKSIADPTDYKQRITAYQDAVRLAAIDQTSKTTTSKNVVINNLVECTYGEMRPFDYVETDLTQNGKIQALSLELQGSGFVGEEFSYEATTSIPRAKFLFVVTPPEGDQVTTYSSKATGAYKPEHEGVYTVQVVVSDGESQSLVQKKNIEIKKRSNQDEIEKDDIKKDDIKKDDIKKDDIKKDGVKKDGVKKDGVKKDGVKEDA